MTLPFITHTTEAGECHVIDIFGPAHPSDSPKTALLKAVLGFDERSGQFTKPLPPKPFRQDIITYILFGKVWGQRPRKPRRPTLASVARSKAAIEVARYEVRPDGSVVVITGKGEPAAPENPWLAELRHKETKR